MSVLSDINEFDKCIETMSDIKSGIFSCIKAKIESKKILKRLDNYDIFELCYGYMFYNINKYEITGSRYIEIIPYEIFLSNKCLKVLTKDFTLTFTNDTFNVYMSYSHDITNFNVSNNLVVPDRISRLWEIVSNELRSVIMSHIKHYNI